jgi:hypothetical protein
MQLFAALMVGHMLADYPLQGDFLARAKNKSAPIPGVPWYQALAAHSIIHGGMVWAITGVWWLGALEAFFHATTDHCKCIGFINFNVDQTTHAICKLWWAAICVWVLA